LSSSPCWRGPKFDRYVSAEERQVFLQFVKKNAEMCETWSDMRICRDPKDDKFLALAIDGKADVLITGDKDLLELPAVGNLRIINAADFLTI
jgi:uncharacterized protein